jgi:hypothetical protein
VSWSEWFDFLQADDSLYFFVSCTVGLLLVVTEMVLLRLRERAILGYLGWDVSDLENGADARD